jgi:uncharacterized protein
MALLSSDRNWRTAHGLVFLAILGLFWSSPIFRSWPWIWLVPLTGYFTLVALIPPLRRTFVWPRIGRLNLRTGAPTAAVIVMSSATLAAYQAIARPDLTALGAALPIQALGGVLLAGVIFPLFNAIFEELVFRGILFDAIESEWGCQVAIGATAILFGFGHLNGYPPGWFGACLAGVYGIILGTLRLQTGGLLLPIAAHVAADATIFWILVREGSV